MYVNTYDVVDAEHGNHWWTTTFIHAWGGPGEVKYDMYKLWDDNDFWYYADIDDTHTGMLFYRAPSKTESWWNQTLNITLGEDNYWAVLDEEQWDVDKNKKKYSSGKYAPQRALIGSMNSWSPIANPFTDNDKNLTIHLTAGNYSFKLIDGLEWSGSGGTISGTQMYHGITVGGGDDITLNISTEGDYVFSWSADKATLSVIYPADKPNALFVKNKYLYVDARGSNWIADDDGFSAKYWFKYASGDDHGSVDCTTPILDTGVRGQVHYALIPDNDYLAKVQINRYSPDLTKYWDKANIILAIDRSPSAQNCLTIPSGVWRDFDPVWSTYCPIKESTTISDNGTVTYGGSGTEGEPFLVEKGTAIKLLASSADYINDANMTTKYNFCKDNVSAQDSESATYQFTANGEAEVTHKVNVNGYNSYNGFSSTEKFSELLFYYTVTCYTVSYNANGGSGDVPVAATKYKAGDDIEVSDKGDLYRPNYIFNGWNTAADGSGTRYAAGSSITGIGSDITLYAQWVSLTTPSVVADSAYYLGEPVAIRLHTVSTGVKEPVVMFYVSDGTETYQVLAAPGSVGEAATEYSTAHSATFYATKAATYTAYAVLYEGKFIDNFEGMASAWSGLGFGECARVANIEREPANGSNKVMMITRNTAAGSQVFNTAWTTTAENSGIQSGWNFSYSYIHMRYYAPQQETPTVEYYNRDEDFRNTSVSDVSANTWHRLTFEVNGGVVDHIHPFVSSGVGNSIYIDDIVLSNEEEMTAILTSGSSAVTIRRPFIIFRTGDKEGDARAEDGDVESYEGGTIDRLIEYRMKVRALDQWYSLCLPFDVQAVQVWDAEDGKYYDIVPFYRTGGKYYNGHYIIRTPSRTTDLAIANFGEWNDPTSAAGYLPAGNTPYIIQWHDAYFQDLYISFFGEPRQTIPTSMTAGSEPSSDDVVNVCVNDAMTSGSAKGAYLLEGDYGDGAWLRLPDATASRTILPFECYILAKSTTAARYKVIRRGATPDDTPTGFPSLSDTPSTVTEKVLIDGQLYIIHGDKMYNTQGIVVEGGK